MEAIQFPGMVLVYCPSFIGAQQRGQNNGSVDLHLGRRLTFNETGESHLFLMKKPELNKKCDLQLQYSREAEKADSKVSRVLPRSSQLGLNVWTKDPTFTEVPSDQEIRRERWSRLLKRRRRPKKHQVVPLLTVPTTETVWQLWLLTHGHQKL
ncbi:uncharacterized protein ACOB8E_024696 isoform 1-T1 [Sarcophilus harrisii]